MTRISKESKRFANPTFSAERAVALVSNDADKGWKEISTVGNHIIWAAPANKKLLIDAYKVTAHTTMDGSSIKCFLEYLLTKSGVEYWEKIDFIHCLDSDYQEMTDTLPDAHVITCEKVRLRVVATNGAEFAICVLVEADEK